MGYEFGGPMGRIGQQGIGEGASASGARGPWQPPMGAVGGMAGTGIGESTPSAPPPVMRTDLEGRGGESMPVQRPTSTSPTGQELDTVRSTTVEPSATTQHSPVAGARHATGNGIALRSGDQSGNPADGKFFGIQFGGFSLGMQVRGGETGRSLTVPGTASAVGNTAPGQAHSNLGDTVISTVSTGIPDWVARDRALNLHHQLRVDELRIETSRRAVAHLDAELHPIFLQGPLAKVLRSQTMLAANGLFDKGIKAAEIIPDVEHADQQPNYVNMRVNHQLTTLEKEAAYNGFRQVVPEMSAEEAADRFAQSFNQSPAARKSPIEVWPFPANGSLYVKTEAFMRIFEAEAHPDSALLLGHNGVVTDVVRGEGDQFEIVEALYVLVKDKDNPDICWLAAVQPGLSPMAGNQTFWLDAQGKPSNWDRGYLDLHVLPVQAHLYETTLANSLNLKEVGIKDENLGEVRARNVTADPFVARINARRTVTAFDILTNPTAQGMAISAIKEQTVMRHAVEAAKARPAVDTNDLNIIDAEVINDEE